MSKDKEKPQYHLVGSNATICFKCDVQLKPGEEVQQIIVPFAASTCEHKTLLRNIHKVCLEKMNG